MSEPIHIISLGAGVQSSTMALMAAHGEITPMPAVAIFADTQNEPESVYRWLGWLAPKLPFPVIQVTGGKLSETSTRIRHSKRNEGMTYLSHNVPAYTINPDGSAGNWRRQCTDKHKLAVLRDEADRLTGGAPSVMWIGISIDEVYRMKKSQRANVTHRWPLVEARMRRGDCQEWLKRNGYPEAPRSACVFCPYHSDREWRRLKTQEPAGFAEAVAYEARLQKAAACIPRLTGIPFLHPSRKPIGTVTFSDEDQAEFSQFNNECEGMCGV